MLAMWLSTKERLLASQKFSSKIEWNMTGGLNSYQMGITYVRAFFKRFIVDNRAGNGMLDYLVVNFQNSMPLYPQVWQALQCGILSFLWDGLKSSNESKVIDSVRCFWEGGGGRVEIAMPCYHLWGAAWGVEVHQWCHLLRAAIPLLYSYSCHLSYRTAALFLYSRSCFLLYWERKEVGGSRVASAFTWLFATPQWYYNLWCLFLPDMLRIICCTCLYYYSNLHVHRWIEGPFAVFWQGCFGKCERGWRIWGLKPLPPAFLFRFGNFHSGGDFYKSSFIPHFFLFSLSYSAFRKKPYV